MRLIDRLLGRGVQPLGASFNGQQLFTYGSTFPTGEGESIPNDFADYVQGAYAQNGVVFAAILARMSMLSEVEFAFQDRDGNLDQNARALDVLDRPWPGATTGDLVARMEQDVSLAGNAFVRRVGDRLERMRPDWTGIVTAEVDGVRQVVGYSYFPQGPNGDRDPITLLVEDVAHWKPIPDPTFTFRGMSWITPIVREVVGDKAMSRHKNRFFDNAATPNIVVSFKERLEDTQRQELAAALRLRHEGADNAYRTMLVDGGADVTVVGNSLEQVSFSTVQAAGENRIAVASGVPGIVLGIKEGLQAATYSNYGQAMRRFADLTIRPLWRSLAGALAGIVEVPADSRLWYDDRRIAALQQDARDDADIQRVNAQAIRTLTDGGFTPESAVQAVLSGDFSALDHTGVFSVQLQPPGDGEEPAEDDARGVNPYFANELRRAEEVDRLRRELAAAKAGRRLSIVRDADGLVAGVEEAVE